MGCGEAPRNRCVPLWCGGGGCVGPLTLWCVPGGVLLSRSLAGAVPSALGVLASGFGMDAGRGTPAMTAGTSMCSRRPACGGWCVLWWALRPPAWGVGVGRGPHSGRARRVCRVPARPVSPGGWVCCLCRPISASQLEWPLRAVHSWSINPVVYWGPPTTPKGWCGYLILKMVSRLDAFSGYPSRT